MLNSYPSLYNLGHKAVVDIFDGEVVIEEKIDGSQLSFGIVNGELKIRSKNCELFVDAPEKMFKNAIDVIVSIKDKLVEGHVYRCEYLSRPHHNVLCYDRVPTNHLVLFDVMTGYEEYSCPTTKKRVADHIGIDCVPVFYSGEITSPSTITDYLSKDSFLGSQKVEGVVIKNYNKFVDKKIMIAKCVSDQFREVAKSDRSLKSRSSKDMISLLISEYRTSARWNKAISHLRDDGVLVNGNSDIGLLIKEIMKDIEKECSDEIKDKLFQEFMPKIMRGVISGFPEYYKDKIIKGF